MVTSQALLEHMAFCADLLRSARAPEDRNVLQHLQELWNALARDGFCLPDLEQQVVVLSEIEERLGARIKPTRH